MSSPTYPAATPPVGSSRIPGRDKPVAVPERFYAAETAYLAAGGPGHAGFAGIAETLDPDVVIHQSSQLPYAGTWSGHRGWRSSSPR